MSVTTEEVIESFKEVNVIGYYFLGKNVYFRVKKASYSMKLIESGDKWEMRYDLGKSSKSFSVLDKLIAILGGNSWRRSDYVNSPIWKETYERLRLQILNFVREHKDKLKNVKYQAAVDEMKMEIHGIIKKYSIKDRDEFLKLVIDEFMVEDVMNK